MEILNRVYVVQYHDGELIELGGIHYQIYTAMDEVEKNGYAYLESGDIGYGQIMRYYKEDGSAGYAEIVEKAVK